MALKTTLAQIEEVQAAITKVMSGQDVWIDGNRISRANLADLERREEKLLIRYRAEQGTGGPAKNIGIPRRN
jgi:hypothetical protein